jgi:hypothetical protein
MPGTSAPTKEGDVLTHARLIPVWFQRGESVAVAIVVAVGFVQYGFDWWWLLALFLIWDLSMIGYALSAAAGAWTYNAVHSYIGPSLLITYALMADQRLAYFIGLAWAFHIAVDRLLGYGLKFTTAFNHTHLGVIGRKPPARSRERVPLRPSSLTGESS